MTNYRSLILSDYKMIMEELTKTTPEEWILWISKEAFEIGANAAKMAGGAFGAPMLFGLSQDLATHHANGLMFWSNSNKDSSMQMVRDIVKTQQHVASAILIRSEIKKDGSSRPSMALVVRAIGKPAKMIVREILEGGELGAVEEYDDVQGRLANFW